MSPFDYIIGYFVIVGLSFLLLQFLNRRNILTDLEPAVALFFSYVWPLFYSVMVFVLLVNGLKKLRKIIFK